MKKLIFATHNEHKLQEVRQMLEPLGVTVLGAGDLNLPDVEETGTTFAENALLKAVSAYQHTGTPVLAEDAGLCIAALEGAPGVYTKRYAEANGGFPKVFDVLAEKLRGQDKSAYFCCTMAYVAGQDEQKVFEGRLNGTLLDKPQGVNGFGYDPVFVPDGFDTTLAQMSAEQKNAISHRHLALEQVRMYLMEK